MPRAICTTCFEVTTFRNTTGSTMPRTCPDCGQDTLTLAQWRDGTWQPISAALRTWITCPLCGKRRNATATNSTTQTLTEPTTFRAWNLAEQESASVTLPAGAIICWHHQPD